MAEDSPLTEDELIVLHFFSEERFHSEEYLGHLRRCAGWRFKIGTDSATTRYPPMDHPFTARLRSAVASLIDRKLLDLQFTDGDTTLAVEEPEVGVALAEDWNWLTYREQFPDDPRGSWLGLSHDKPYFQVVPTALAADAYKCGMEAVGRVPYGCWPEDWTMGTFESVEAEVRALTALMRGDDDPMHEFYVRLRELMLSQGLDPDTTLHPACDPRGYFDEHGWLVAVDGSVIEFSVKPQPDGPAGLAAWNDVTRTWSRNPIWCRERIKAALDIVQQG